MKDSLHFILLGVLGLLGVVMMAVGVVAKTGAEDKLNNAAKAVSGALAGGVPTAGEVKALEAAQAKFNGEVEGMRSAFTNAVGGKLFEFTKTYNSSDDFNTEVVSKELPRLRDGFARLKNSPKLPDALTAQGARLPDEDESAAFWASVQSEMRSNTNVQEIPKLQARLKVMREVLIACEKLLQSSQFKGLPFVFRRFEFGNFNQEGSTETKDPWLKHEFMFVFDGEPSFGLALMDALLFPTEATCGKGDGKRDGLPFALVSMVALQPERPHVAQFMLPASERAAYEIPGEWREGDEANKFDEGGTSSKRYAIAADLEKKLVISLPLRFELKLHALRANPTWKPIAVPAETPASG